LLLHSPKAIVDLIKLEETTNRPSGEVLQWMGNTVSKTHLYGSKDIFNWIAKHPYSMLVKKAKKAKKEKGALHTNKPTPAFQPENVSGIRMF
jgi:hypothetical protein